MTKLQPFRKAAANSAPYAAGAHLYKTGPLFKHELFAAVDFGPLRTRWDDSLQSSITSGWLVERMDGRIDCSPHAHQHYAIEAGEEKVEYIGQITPPRYQPDVFARPPLSKRYIPNPRGMRQDIPEWSVRNSVSFHTKA